MCIFECENNFSKNAFRSLSLNCVTHDCNNTPFHSLHQNWQQKQQRRRNILNAFGVVHLSVAIKTAKWGNVV